MEKNLKKQLNWFRLDNAAKIFPPTAHGLNTGVFRLSCELNELVCENILQQALDESLKQYPHMSMILRKGIFWYYLEETETKIKVEPEIYLPCASIYNGSKSSLLRVTYWKNKVNIDVFHVIADGAGATKFFEFLIEKYLLIAHKDIIIENNESKKSSTVYSRSSDGFQKYYNNNNFNKNDVSKDYKPKDVYKIKDSKRNDNNMTIIEGVAKLDKVIEIAHKHNVTLTVYLASVLFCAIAEQMYERHKDKTVVLTIPVDLRTYFPTDTARNFFSTVRIGYNFKNCDCKIENIIKSTAKNLKNELRYEKLAARMNMLSSLEHNFLLRFVPLIVKNAVLRISGDISSLAETAALSNIGRFELSKNLNCFVKGFGVFMSTNSIQLCTCTFENNIHFGFTSAFKNTDIQRYFFKNLVDEGIEMEIRSNDFYKEEIT